MDLHVFASPRITLKPHMGLF